MVMPQVHTPLVTREEWELLAGVVAKDDAAVRRFYRAHVERVHRVVVRVLGARDGDVEDVVQQVFLAAIDGAHRFEGRSKVSTWLLGIAARRAMDAVRNRARASRWDQVREWVGMGTRSLGPEERRDARLTVDRALGSLTADQRMVFVLCEVEGHTLQEVADMTGVGLSTLHARIKAARKRIDAVLGAAEGGSGGAA